MKAFGTKFVIANDVRQPLTAFNKTASGRYFIHLATVVRGFKQYMAYLEEETNSVWIDEIDSKDPSLLKAIESDEEWADVKDFMTEAGLLLIKTDAEFKAAPTYIV